jgi:hypothetical protein
MRVNQHIRQIIWGNGHVKGGASVLDPLRHPGKNETPLPRQSGNGASTVEDIERTTIGKSFTEQQQRKYKTVALHSRDNSPFLTLSST